MRTDKKSLIAGVVLGVLAAVTISGVSAYRGDPSVQGPNYTPERHEAMTSAFAANDYDTWASLMDGKGRVTDVVNADNFSKFVEAHDLAANGDLQGAKAIRAELGLGLKDGNGKGQGRGEGRGNGQGKGNKGGNGGRGGNNGNCVNNN